MRSVRDTHEKLRYIHRNPVRRGLVARAEDWPWSSALAWATGAEDPMKIDRETLPVLILTNLLESY
jgi:putative transposase